MDDDFAAKFRDWMAEPAPAQPRVATLVDPLESLARDLLADPEQALPALDEIRTLGATDPDSAYTRLTGITSVLGRAAQIHGSLPERFGKIVHALRTIAHDIAAVLGASSIWITVSFPPSVQLSIAFPVRPPAIP